MKVSVIIPVYNTENTIARCLDSVLSQSISPYEIIIVDDRGQDNAIEIAKEYAKNNDKIKIIIHPKNLGLMYARRTGYENASGDYLMFLDSDDTLPQDSISSFNDFLSNNKCDIVIGGYKKIWENPFREELKLPKTTHVITSNEAFVALLKHKLSHNLAFAIFSKNLFNHHYYTIPNQTNGEDLILFYQLIGQANNIGVINNPVYNYYQYQGSSTHKKIDDNILKQFVNIQKFKYDFLKERNIDKETLLKNIIPLVVRWYRFADAKEYILQLDPALIREIKYTRAINYLSFKESLLYILTKKNNFISKLIRNRFN